MSVFLNLLKTFGLKALYGIAGLLAAYLLATVPSFHPTGTTDEWLWKWILVPALIGLAGVLRRIATWDPGKVGK
jgi:H+/Cl- antiporter ClcA